MINKRWALSVFVVAVLIFMVGLSGCDMGSKTITEIEDAEGIEGGEVEATAIVTPDEYSISGYKINADTEEGLNGWEVKLFKVVEGEKVLEGTTVTDTKDGIIGYYEFTGLEEGVYIVEEVLQTGWEQVYPDDPGYYEIILPDDADQDKAVENINFENKEIIVEPEYSISGSKINYDTDNGIEDWEITLTKLNDVDFAPITINTDENGNYIFEGLRAGEYRVEEETREGWEAVGQISYDISLPYENSENGNAININFENKEIVEELVCFDDTIWAADGNPGATRFVNRGNWATYVEYEIGAGDMEDPVEYPLYAGQDHEAGSLEVYDDDGKIFVRYLIGSDQDDSYKDGYCGSWSYLTEYHLQIVNEFSEFDSVRTRQGNPIPGQFEYSEIYELEDEMNDTDWIEVEKEAGDFEGTVYIAAHGVAQWCGYLCEIE